MLVEKALYVNRLNRGQIGISERGDEVACDWKIVGRVVGILRDGRVFIGLQPLHCPMRKGGVMLSCIGYGLTGQS